MQGLMRKIPGAPELEGTGSGVLIDNIAVYRARHAGTGLLDFARMLADSGYAWRAFGFPGQESAVVPPRGSFEEQISVAPGALLTSITTVSDQPEGFRWRMSDRTTGETLGNNWFQHGAEAGYIGTTAGALYQKYGTLRPLPQYLTSPWMVSQGGMLNIELVNLSPNANSICLFLAFAEPRGPRFHQ